MQGKRPGAQLGAAPYVPTEAGHGPCRTLHDMTPEEIAALERQYGMPVRPRPRQEPAAEDDGDAPPGMAEVTVRLA